MPRRDVACDSGSVFALLPQDQVKILKWDEQSYFSLRSSAEKSHAVLHKLVCEYNDVLQSPVAALMDAELQEVASGAITAAAAPSTFSERFGGPLGGQYSRLPAWVVDAAALSYAGLRVARVRRMGGGLRIQDYSQRCSRRSEWSVLHCVTVRDAHQSEDVFAARCSQ